MKGIKYSAKEKYKALTMWLNEKVDILKVSKKFKCSERTLWRWKTMFDGTIESLQNKSSRPHTKHPNAHTAEEWAQIAMLLKERPDIGYAEALGELRQKYAYKRTYFGFYRFVVKNGLRPHKLIEKRENKPYDTPEMLGIKMQMDVKYVPLDCNVGKFRDERFYQYSIIDEATRERFIYAYKEKSGYSTRDFVKRALIYFGYLPKTIQTDNGTEFTNPKGTGEGKIHTVDILLNQIGVKHQLIRAYTPRHNGKIERSHRSDQEGFYNKLKFSSFEELQEKMSAWLTVYNNRPHSALRNREGKKVWQTPLQKRAELLEILREIDNEPKIRFLKKKS